MRYLTLLLLTMVIAGVHRALSPASAWTETLRMVALPMMLGLAASEILKRMLRGSTPRTFAWLLVTIAAGMLGAIALYGVRFRQAPPATPVDWLAFAVVVALPIVGLAMTARVARDLKRSRRHPERT